MRLHSAKTYIAIAAAFGVAVGLAANATRAADLGGSCCGDLEERIAELEATTVRKGNRKVTLTLSGYVSHSVLAWNDGTNRDVYIGDGGAVSSRFRFVGEGRMTTDLSAGFIYEFGAVNNRLGSMNQLNGGDDLGGLIEVRQSAVYLKSATLGSVKIGHGSTATDDLILIDTSSVGAIAFSDVSVFNGSFLIRSGGALTPLTWGQAFNGGVSFDTARRNHVMYSTPTLAGFALSAAAGENNFWDVALRYAGEMGGFNLAGGIGYSVDSEMPAFGPLALNASKIKDLKGSASAKHMATGLFATVAAGRREIDWSVAFGPFSASAKDAWFYHAIVGIERNVFGIGASGLYAEYQQAKDMIGYSLAFGPAALSIGSDARMWGFGVTQRLDGAAADLFLGYKNYSAEATASGVIAGKVKADTFDAIIGGMKVSF